MKIGFIDYYLDEWHANNYPQWIRKASGGEMEVVCAYALIDSPIGGRTTAKWCEDMQIAQAPGIEAVVEASDALIVLSPDNAEMHEQLCQIPLRSGKPTYVDKTFAPDGQTARRIFAIAEESGTPCFTTSALRYASEYKGIDKSDIQAIASWGAGGVDTYAIHQVEPIIMMMQNPVRRVQYVPGKEWYSLTLVLEDGRVATITGVLKGSPFAMNLCAAGGNRVITVESDFFGALIADMVKFFRDRKIPVPHGETLQVMDALEAAFRAKERPFEWVEV